MDNKPRLRQLLADREDQAGGLFKAGHTTYIKAVPLKGPNG